MVEQNFSDSPYRFTEPVRYFKANDPYYFEVDNIPIKQLEENCLWLKDQISKFVQEINITPTVTRADITELKPYATGTDRIIRVKPGRFSARINDVRSKPSLQYFSKLFEDELTGSPAFQFTTGNSGSFGGNYNDLLVEALSSFKTSLANKALGMTGLEERAFTWPIKEDYMPSNSTGLKNPGPNDSFPSSDFVSYASQSTVNTIGSYLSPGLISQVLLWATSQFSTQESFVVNMYTPLSSGFSQLPLIESNLLKKWRGVARFAIVDVPEELSIEVPSFDSEDFQFLNESGNEVNVDDVQTRIDLVFLYAKPVDASGAKIVKNNSLATITKPELGIIRGAGIKYSAKGVSDVNVFHVPKSGYDSEGNTKILASPGDQFNENMGFFAASANDIFQDVKGSFPAPDDLLNIAPLLSEKLEENAFELIGQTILPLAYVFVQKEEGDTTNTAVVDSESVIDIRPFFRTAELSYNERAGIAAASPQLSLANPPVGKAELRAELSQSYNDLLSKYNDTLVALQAKSQQIKVPEYRFLEQPYTVFSNVGFNDTGTLGTASFPKTWYIDNAILPEDVLDVAQLAGGTIYDDIVAGIYTVESYQSTPQDTGGGKLDYYGGSLLIEELVSASWISMYRASNEVKKGTNAGFRNINSFIGPLRKSTLIDSNGVQVPKLSFLTALNEGGGSSHRITLKLIGYIAKKSTIIDLF